MNRYFVREGETEACPALKVHVLSFAFLPSDSATDVILVCRSANSMGKHRPHKKSKSGSGLGMENLNFSVFL